MNDRQDETTRMRALASDLRHRLVAAKADANLHVGDAGEAEDLEAALGLVLDRLEELMKEGQEA